ncbi:uncharacterized protein V1518DRAFT_434351 [Limtongia smithiae]|uniref:uncharacterized protein n=1 Tax=Limtongia smithiae TaxID=1125753 RepID=UPI0034CE50FB
MEAPSGAVSSHGSSRQQLGPSLLQSSASSSSASSSGSRVHSIPGSISHVLSRQLLSKMSARGRTSTTSSNSRSSLGVDSASSSSHSSPASDSRESSVSRKPLDRRPSYSTSKESGPTLTTGLCMCCLSSLRFPETVPCFRCTVCQTTTDVTPVSFKSVQPINSDTLSMLCKIDSLAPEDRQTLEAHLIAVFQSSDALNQSFANGKNFTFSETGLSYSDISTFYHILMTPGCQNLMNGLLKSSETLLKRPGKVLSSAGDLKFLLIIFENPVLYARRSAGRHSPILKRLFGLISSLNSTCHLYLVNWFARLQTQSFKMKVEMINSFTSHRLSKYCAVGNGGADIDQYGSDWRIRAAARTLSLFFAANIRVSKVPTSNFYNTMVDYIDITHDFDRWEKQGIPTIISPTPRSPGWGHSSSMSMSPSTSSLGQSIVNMGQSPVKVSSGSQFMYDHSSAMSSGALTPFTFCQYPFFLSMGSKITILEYDARRQMEIKAREAFFSTLNYKRVVQPHLILKVRRNCLIEDSLQQISSYETDIKKGLKIEFVGEDGVDAGGLRKEWFLLLAREMFDPLNGMFIYDEDSNYCWFNCSTFETADQYYLSGVVLGLAIYNSTILDIQFPPALFKKLLGCQCTLDDLKILRPSLAKGLKQLLDFEGNVEEAYCRDFVAEHDNYGSIVQVPLVPGGEHKAVTNSNRQEFVNRYVNFIFDISVDRQFQPFKRGFYHVIGGNALTLFRPEEIELLVRGSDDGLDIDALRAVAIYDGWGPAGSSTKMTINEIEESEPVINWFWEIFGDMEVVDQRRLLTFVTGSDRIPATGVANLIFKISKVGEDSDRFPISHTCFNQLCLYRYSSKAKLEAKLIFAIMESKGFGLR